MMTEDRRVVDGIRYDGYILPRFKKLEENVNRSMEEIKNLKSRDGDILLCAFPKSGSNWVYEIITMILGGEASYAPKHKHSAGMLELVPLDMISEEYPRILNSHLPFRHLPEEHLQQGRKVIHVVRNPKDVCVSWFHHKMNSKIFGDGYPNTWSDFVDAFITNTFNMYDGWFNYENAFEKGTGHCDYVHTTFYEDLKINPIQEIEKLAKFLECRCSQELIHEIAEKTSFDNLSKAARLKEDNSDIIARSKNKTNFVFRKGIIGDWKNWFTVAQNERFDDVFNREMKQSKHTFVFQF